MKIILLGANGRTGREILNRALNAGDAVTAVVRSEDSLTDVSHSQLSIQIANVCDPNALKQILPGHDIVISTLGPRMPTKVACAIYSEFAKAIVEAMKVCGVKRLLVTSTALLFPSGKLLDRILGFIARPSVRHAGLMEGINSASDLEWTIARMGFLNDKSSKNFRVAEGTLPDGGSSISRAAVAHFFLTEAKQSSYVNKVVGLCG